MRVCVLSVLGLLATTLFADHTLVAIHSLHPNNGPTLGGYDLTISGEAFSVSQEVIVNIGGQTVMANATFYHTIVLAMPSGLGAAVPVTVTSAGATSAPAIFMYHAPMIVSVSPDPNQEWNHTIVNSVTITGANFDSSPSTATAVSVMIGAIECTGAVIVDSQSVTCSFTVAAHYEEVIGNVSVTISATNGSRTSMGPRVTVAAAVPIVSQVIPANAPAAGGYPLTIVGSFFGANIFHLSSVTDVGAQAYFGVVGSLCTSRSSETELIATVPAVVADSQLDVRVFSNGKWSTTSVPFLYDLPIVEAVDPFLYNDDLDVYVNVFGRNFGAPDSFSTVNIGGIPCINSVLINSTILRCLFHTPPSAEPFHGMVQVQIADSFSGQTDVYFHVPQARPIVHSINPTNGPTFGGSLLTVTGLYFGKNDTFTPHVWVGEFQSPCTTWVSPTEVVAQVPAGVGSNLAVRVQVELLKSNMSSSFLFTYDRPEVLTVTPNAVGPHTINTLTITGNNFSPLLQFPNTVEIGGNACVVTLETETAIECTLRVHPTSSFFDEPVYVTAGGQQNTNLDVIFHVDPAPPEVLSLSPANAPTHGWSEITATGLYFGVSADTGPGSEIQLYINGDICPNTRWVSDNTSVCTTPPGVGADLDVTGKLWSWMGPPSTTARFAYDRPTIATVTPSMGVSGVPTELEIRGTNFAPSPDLMNPSQAVFIGGQPCAETKIYNSFFATCVFSWPETSDGFVGEAIIVVQQQSNLAGPQFVIPQANPVVSSLSASNAPTVGGPTITVNGLYFGSSADFKPIVYFADQESPCTTYVSNTQLTAVVPRANKKFINVAVTVQSKSKKSLLTDNVKFTYDKPVVTSILPVRGTPSQVNAVTVTGFNFPTQDLSTQIWLGPLECGSPTWVSETSLTCAMYVPPSTYVYIGHAIVNVGGQYSDLVPDVSFTVGAADPIVSSFQGTSPGPSVGGTVLTVSGLYFGFPLDQAGPDFARVFFQAEEGDMFESTDVTFVSNTTLIVVTPPGHGAQDSIIVHVGTETWTVENVEHNVKFDYIVPTVTSVTPDIGRAARDQKVTVTGANFGVTPTVSVGENDCVVSYLSDTHDVLECTFFQTLTVFNVALQVVVHAGNQDSTDPVAYTLVPPYPEVYAIEPAHGPAAGNYTVTVTGDYFGPTDSVATKLWVDGFPCRDNVWLSRYQMTATVVAGVGAGLTVEVSNTQENTVLRDPIVNASVGYSYDAAVPTHYWAEFRDYDFEASVVTATKDHEFSSNTVRYKYDSFLTVYGFNFGNRNEGLTVTVDGVSCVTPVHVSDTKLTCYLPRFAQRPYVFYAPIVIVTRGVVGNGTVPISPETVEKPEDTGFFSVMGFANRLRMGPDDPNAQPTPSNTPTYGVTVDQAHASGFFASAPVLSTLGLLCAVSPNKYGNATVQVVRTLGSDTQTTWFFINITEVNDPPTFEVPYSHVVGEDSGCHSVPDFAFNMHPGTNEFDTWYFEVQTDNVTMFSQQPAIDRNGTLTFCGADSAFGVAAIRIRMVDSGGTQSGGVNYVLKESHIAISSVNDPPSFEFNPSFIALLTDRPPPPTPAPITPAPTTPAPTTPAPTTPAPTTPAPTTPSPTPPATPSPFVPVTPSPTEPVPP